MISHSDLIITNKGQIYHLGLTPNDIANTIIFVGDPKRVKKVSKYFDKIEVKAEHREFITHTGYIGKKRISVMSTGMGPDNIDIAINEIDALLNVDFNTRIPNEQKVKASIIRLGTSGSLQKEIPIDSIIVSKKALGIDNVPYFYNSFNNIENRLLKSINAHLNYPHRLINYATKASDNLLKKFDQYESGITVTCPGFYGPQGRSLRTQLSYPDFIQSLSRFKFRDLKISNFEMETSAIYALSGILGHESISVNAILANRIDNVVSKDPKKVVKRMIKESLKIIEKL